MMALRRGQGAGRPLTATSRFVPMVGELSNLPGDGEPALGLRGSPRNAVRHLQLPAMGSQTTCRSNATKGTRWAPKSSAQSTARCESCAPKSAGLPRLKTPKSAPCPASSRQRLLRLATRRQRIAQRPPRTPSVCLGSLRRKTGKTSARRTSGNFAIGMTLLTSLPGQVRRAMGCRHDGQGAMGCHQARDGLSPRL